MSRRVGRVVRAPIVEFVVALAGMVGGAWLIGMWAVGVVAVVASVLVAVHAVLRDDGSDVDHQTVLEKYWRTR